MADRAAIVTGASRGIGRAIAETLGELGYDLTITARKPDGLAEAAEQMRARGWQVEEVAANLAQVEAVETVVAAHRERFGRLDVLVNNAGVGIGATATEQEPRFVDMQLGVNLRATILFYKHAIEMLRQAGAEHRSAVVINMASIAGVRPQPWLSVYAATKAGVIAYTSAMNKELGGDGIKSVAFCPGFVDTDMSEFAKEQIPAEEMLKTSDIASAVRFMLSVSPACVIPEIVFQRPGDGAL